MSRVGRRLLMGAALALAVAYIVLIVVVDRGREEPSQPAEPLLAVPEPRPQPPPVLLQNEQEVLKDAARRAWRFVERNYHESTGLVSPLDHYPVTTMWDMGSALAAHFSARELGLISDSLYRGRLRRILRGLEALPVFAGTAFNKRYYSTSIGMAGPRDEPSPGGYGWSALDIGRLLLWLDIVRSDDDSLAAAAASVAGKLRLDRIVANGELLGSLRRARGIWRYQEGRIGYEQYAARGFARWGADVKPALDLLRHAEVVEVGSDRLLRDYRGQDCLTSEPFLLIGLEVGWHPNEGKAAQALLRAQQARFEKTGRLTALSEDALSVPPHHFYYFCALAGRDSFVVLSPLGARIPNGPRTISAKAAFGWYALLPNAYTAQLLTAVRDAAVQSEGWPSAWFETTLQPAGGENINTAAVILESAAYVARGRRPLDRR